MRLFEQITDLLKPRRAPAVALTAPLDPHFYDASLTEWGSLWGIPDLATRVRVTFSQRLTRSLGRCTPRTGSIRLNTGLLNADPRMLREVLCHEAAHAAAWILHGRRARPHGRGWKQLMRSAGYEPRVRWTGPTGFDVARRRKPSLIYVHTCPVCSTGWTARRAVRTWRCGSCRKAGLDGRLEISTRPARRQEAH